MIRVSLPRTALLLGWCVGFPPPSVAGQLEGEAPSQSLPFEAESLADLAQELMTEGFGEGEEAGTVSENVSRLRGLYFLSVENEDRLEEARGLAELLRRTDSLPPSQRTTVVALSGALELVRAKHSSWPPNKLRFLRAGAAVLDSVVAVSPAHIEARYLRLTSYSHLPPLFRREGSVREDLEALAQLLPQGRGPTPPSLFRAAVELVLDEEVADESAEGLLRKALEEEGSPDQSRLSGPGFGGSVTDRTDWQRKHHDHHE